MEEKEPDTSYLPTAGGTQAVTYPQTDPKVMALYQEGKRLLEFATAREIKTNEDLVAVTEDLSIIAGTKKALEAIRKDYTRPIREHLDKVNQVFQEFTEPIISADQINRQKISEHRQTVERARREAEETNRMAAEVAQRQAEASGTGEYEVDTTPVIVPEEAQKRVNTEMGSIGTQKVYKWNLVDIDLVPRQYMMINTVLVGQVVRSTKGQLTIPGIEIYTEDVIKVKTK